MTTAGRRHRRQGSSRWPGLAAAACCLAAAPALAQDAGRSTSVSAQVAASETYTETRNSVAVPNGGQFVTRLSPSVSLSSRSGRVQGSFNYTLNALYRSEQADATEVQHALNASFTAEAVENWAYIDARATISQQSLSAYGTQTLPDSTQANANRAEVGTASFSPYVRGVLGGAVNYEVRLNANINEVRRTSDSDSINTGGSVSLSSAARGSRLGWALSVNQQTTEYKLGRKTASDRANLSLTYTPVSDLQLSINGGQEATDVGLVERRNYDNWGAGARWTPTERTSIRVQGDRRYFGNSHSVSVEHRMQRSSLSYTDTRDSSNGAGANGANGVGQPITLYELLYAQRASAQPDPVLREQEVLDFLRAIGRDPGEILRGGTLNSAVTLQRRQDLSFAWLGLRTTFNVQAFASQTRLLDNPNGAPDDGGPRLRGYTASLSYRLTPVSSLTLTGGRQITDANAINAGNELKSLTLGWSTQPGRRINTSLSARYAVFNSSTSPYRETSVTATASLRF